MVTRPELGASLAYIELGSPDPLALAMAQGGYAAAGTGDGLHAAFPTITPAAMAAALAQAYPG